MLFFSPLESNTLHTASPAQDESIGHSANRREMSQDDPRCCFINTETVFTANKGALTCRVFYAEQPGSFQACIWRPCRRTCRQLYSCLPLLQLFIRVPGEQNFNFHPSLPFVRGDVFGWITSETGTNLAYSLVDAERGKAVVYRTEPCAEIPCF